MKKITKLTGTGMIALSQIAFVSAQSQKLSGQGLKGIFFKPFEGNLLNVLSQIFTWVIAIAGIIAFVFLIIGGFEYLTAGGDPDKAGKGRTTITNAIIGLIIVAISFLLISFLATNIGGGNIVEPDSIRTY